MKAGELSEKGYIDVRDNIEFRTHADVMRLFGKDKKILQSAFLKHPHEDGVHIWFPIIAQNSDPDWINNWGLNEDKVFEKKVNGHAEYLAELFDRPDRHKRILFAKIAPYGRAFYKFKGIYHFDPVMSRDIGKAVYERVARSAKLYKS